MDKENKKKMYLRIFVLPKNCTSCHEGAERSVESIFSEHEKEKECVR